MAPKFPPRKQGGRARGRPKRATRQQTPQAQTAPQDKVEMQEEMLCLQSPPADAGPSRRRHGRQKRTCQDEPSARDSDLESVSSVASAASGMSTRSQAQVEARGDSQKEAQQEVQEEAQKEAPVEAQQQAQQEAQVEAQDEAPIQGQKKKKKSKEATCHLTNEQLDDLQDWLTRKPELYDLKHPQHRNKEHCNALYAAKADELGVTVVQLRNKVKYIRDTVGRVNRHDKTGEGAKRITESDRSTYSNFKFLLSHIHTKPSRSTTKVADPDRRRMRPPVQTPDGDDGDGEEEVEEEEEEEVDTQGEEAQLTKASVTLAPIPKKKQKKTKKSKKEEEQSKILEEMKAAMEQGSTVRAEIQTMLGIGGGQNSPRSRERRSFGQYLDSVLPTIHDSLWLDFRFEMNKVLDNYQRKSRDLERVPAPPQPQLTTRMQQAQQSTSLTQQQVVAHQLQQTLETSCTQSPMHVGLAQWQHQYQRPEQTYLFPEGQTTFTPQQMALFDQPRYTAPTALGAPPVHTGMVRIRRAPLVQTVVGPSSATSTVSTPAAHDIAQVPTSSPMDLNTSQQGGDFKSVSSDCSDLL